MSAAAVVPVATRRSPYQGLVPYTESDAEWFFGRQEWCEVVGDNLRAYRIAVLYGASGVGKSSLLRAGLMRQLCDEARENLAALEAPRMLPVYFSAWSLDDPMAALKEAVAAAAAQIGNATADEPDAGPLSELLAGWPIRVEGPLLLVLDQLEELFVYHDRRGDSTLEELTAALRSRDPAVHFLLSIREDALAKLDRFEGHVPGLLDHLLQLEQLERDHARAAIRGPLEHWTETGPGPVGAEPALVEAVLDEVEAGKVTLADQGTSAAVDDGQPAGVEAPYLQLVLERLWDEERREGSRLLRLQTLRRLGGATEIVRTHLDAALASLPARDQDVAGRMLPYLVTPSGTKIALRLVDLSAFARLPEARLTPVVDALAGDVRILRPAGDGRFEIYHDALAGPILDWNARWEARQKRRRLGRRLGIFGAALLLVAIAATFAYLAVTANNAQDDARRGQSRALAAQALATLDSDPMAALTSAREAAEMSPTGEAEGALRAVLSSQLPRRTLRGHSGRVWTAAFSPDGERVITSSGDGTARIWDTASGRTLYVLRGHRGRVRSASFSPDGTRVLTSSGDGTARIWDADDGRELLSLQRHQGPVWGASFSSDGERVLTFGDDHAVRIWDAGSGSLLHTLHADRRVRSAAFSADAKLVVTAGDDKTARVWETSSGHSVWTLGGHQKGHEKRVRSAAFSPDGTLVVTASDDSTARIWSVETGQSLHRLVGHDAAVRSASFSPDGKRVLTASDDGTARLWASGDGRLLQILPGHQGSVRSASFSPDGTRVVTTSNDAAARLWETRSGHLLDIFRGHGGAVVGAAFGPRGNVVVTASDDHTARLWNTVGTPSLKIFRRRSGSVRGASVSPDGRLVVTGGQDGTATIWDVRTSRLLHTVRASPRSRGIVQIPWTSAVFSPNGRLVATASNGGTARLFDATSGRLLHILVHRTPSWAVLDADFSRDGTRLVTAGYDHTARIWNSSNGRLLHTLRHVGHVWSATFSPDGKLVATAADDGSARIWNAAAGRRPLHTLPAHFGFFGGSAAFSPDGKFVVTAGGDDTARLWDTATGGSLHTLVGHSGQVINASFSPDGRLVVTASDDGTARLWDTASGRSLVTLRGHTRGVGSAIFSPDGKLVLTASRDKTVRLWDAATGRPLDVLRSHDGYGLSAAFSAGGKLIVTAGASTVRIWPCELCNTSLEDLLARARERLAAP